MVEDIKRVAVIADKLRKLGVPEKVCRRIDIWNKKREEELQKKQ